MDPVAPEQPSSWLSPEARPGTSSVLPCSSSSRGFRASTRPGAIHFSVRVEQGIGPVRLGEFGIGDRALEPPVVRLTSYSKYPTRHRDGDAVSGELAHERVPPCAGTLAWDRYAAARRRRSFSCSNSRTRGLASRSPWDSADVVPGLIPASTSALRIHFCNVMGWIPKSAAICS